MKVFHLTSVHARYDNRVLNKQCVSLGQYFDTTLIVADGLGVEEYNGVHILDVGRPQNRISRMLFKAFAVFNLARMQGADAYQIHDPELLPWGFVYSLLGKKVIYDIHEDYITSISIKSYMPIWFRKSLAFVFGGLEKLLSFKMYRLIAEKYYSRRFLDAVAVLNYPAKQTLSDIEAFDSNSSVLIYTGNVTPDRGAIKMAEIARELKNFNFKLVGKCNESTYSKLNFGGLDNLELVGLNRYVPFDEITSNYQQGALVGLALFPENKHYAEKELTKFFEYMAVGLPIIASNFPVWKELIEGNDIGICVDVDNHDEIVSAINWLKDNPEDAKEMGLRGKALVKSSLNWEAEFNKLLNLYKEIEMNLSK